MAADTTGGRPAGPAFTIIATGHTVRGWPWLIIRKRGGAHRRITVEGANATPEGVAAAVARAVASMPDGPIVDHY